MVRKFPLVGAADLLDALSEYLHRGVLAGYAAALLHSAEHHDVRAPSGPARQSTWPRVPSRLRSIPYGSSLISLARLLPLEPNMIPHFEE
jgi:hypothetical protein